MLAGRALCATEELDPTIWCASLLGLGPGGQDATLRRHATARHGALQQCAGWCRDTTRPPPIATSLRRRDLLMAYGEKTRQAIVQAARRAVAPINRALSRLRTQGQAARASGTNPMTTSRQDLTRLLAPTRHVTVLREAGREGGCRVEPGRLRRSRRQARHPTRRRPARPAGGGHRRLGRLPVTR